MASSAITQKLDGQRFIWKNGLAVEAKDKYGQRSCFSKIVHRKQYDSKKILAALQSLYSKSLTKEEAACLKKNIRITMRQVAKDNVKAQQMCSFTRWLFNKHVVDLKPHTQTFEKLQSITFSPKLQEKKGDYDKIAKELEDLQKTDLHHALIIIPAIHKDIQTGLKALQDLKQPHRPAKDIEKITAQEDEYEKLQVKLKGAIAKVDEDATSFTDAHMKEAMAKSDVPTIKKCLSELESHRDIVEACQKKLQVSFNSLHHTKKAIEECQKAIEALESKDHINEILEKVKKFPSQTFFDPHYLKKANAILDEAKSELEKIQKNLPVHSSPFKQIQKELLALEEARQSLLKSFQQIFASLKVLKPLLQKKHTNLADFLSDDALFTSEKEKLQQCLKALNPIKYDLLSMHVEKLIKAFDIKHQQFQKCFDFDQYVASTIVPHQSQLISELKSKYLADADFTKNTEAILSMAEAIKLMSDVKRYLPQGSPHAYYGKLVATLALKRMDIEKELFEPFYKVLNKVQLTPGDDFQTLMSNWDIVKTANKQYCYLAICDSIGTFGTNIHFHGQEVKAKFRSHFQSKVQEMHTQWHELIKKYNDSKLSKEQAELFAKERDATQAKIKAISEEHKPHMKNTISLISNYESKMKAEIETFSSYSKLTTQCIESDLAALATFEENVKTCQELQASTIELGKVDSLSGAECLVNMSKLDHDIQKRREISISITRAQVLHYSFAIDALADLKKQVQALYVLQKEVDEKLKQRINELTA